MNRLVQGMGRLGRGMAGVAGARETLGEVVAAAEEAAAVEEGKGKEKEKGGQQGQGQAGKKKKKGRK